MDHIIALGVVIYVTTHRDPSQERMTCPMPVRFCSFLHIFVITSGSVGFYKLLNKSIHVDVKCVFVLSNMNFQKEIDAEPSLVFQ